jgi:hypothetical protein
MKSIYAIGVLFLLNFFGCSRSEVQLSLESKSFTLEIDDGGNIVGLKDLFSGENHLHSENESPLLSIGIEGELYLPHDLQVHPEDKLIELNYGDIGISSSISYEVKDTHINFELRDISSDKEVDFVVWGPFHTDIGKVVGETVGVVQHDDFAIGIQALNIKTLGGFPTNEDDTEPAYDIFATNSLTDVADSVKVLYRGQTARITDYGSKLQAYCRNRNETKVIPVWGHEQYTVPAYDDGGVTGSKIAIFGSAPANALEVLSTIEIAEGLPHPEINGEWAKTSPEATASYLIMPFGRNNFNEAIELTKKAGLKYLYHGGPFETWGHFQLQEETFPENWDSMAKLVESAEEQGIHLGVHTLSNFISTNDPYVSPVPDKRLAKVGSTVLKEYIDPTVKEILIDDPVFFNQMENNNLHTVQVGDELIRYEKVSEEGPWKLLNCERGAFGTRAAEHLEGDTLSKLMDHGYQTFLGNAELSKEIAVRIADFCNTTGIRQISFDGLEGNWASGMGQYARQLFVNTWYEHLKPELKGEIINDASNPGHYFWHIFTRMNWGEPWYAGFRESQTQYRLMNQDYFDRNLMPNMLGWFSLSSETSLMDVEWLLARSAGFDAGFGLSTSYEALNNNGQSDLLLRKIKTWEQARLNGAFEPNQKTSMKDIDNEFTLLETGKNEYELRKVLGEVYELTHKEKQPGEPNVYIIDFSNNFAEQPLQFWIAAKEEGTISNIQVELNHYVEIEIPVDLGKGQILSYEGGKNAILYDKNWNVIKEVALDTTQLRVSSGDQQLRIKLDGSHEVTARLELKVVGEPIPLKGKYNIR